MKNNSDIYFRANIIYNISTKVGVTDEKDREYCG